MFPPRRSSLLQHTLPTSTRPPPPQVVRMDSIDGMESMEEDEATMPARDLLPRPNRTFVDTLPLPLVARVFALVGVEETVQCARGVCVSWTALYSIAELWTDLVMPRHAIVLSSANKTDAISSVRLLASHGQRSIVEITLEGHGIDSSDTGIMQYLPRIITPTLRHVAFQHVGLSFERRQFLTVFQQATNVSSLRITRRKFRRATVLSPLLGLYAGTLTHLRLDNLVVEHIPDIGALAPGLTHLHLDGPFELVFWAESSATLSFAQSLMPRLRRLSITNVEYETDDSVTKLMTLFVSRCPVLEELVFSCDGYMMDLWPCAEFWGTVQRVECSGAMITSDFASVLFNGLCQLRDHNLAMGVVKDYTLQLALHGCDVEDVALVRSLFGDGVC
ncbi:hypothetical protein BC830DRAFT_145079 [Chytriomyces sp. MP71]|nr:hypothetical protein BC830DRAFT_145079 [Chytriomyces sp. MP71]